MLLPPESAMERKVYINDGNKFWELLYRLSLPTAPDEALQGLVASLTIHACVW